jgi:hypothetical protein
VPVVGPNPRPLHSRQEHLGSATEGEGVPLRQSMRIFMCGWKTYPCKMRGEAGEAGEARKALFGIFLGGYHVWSTVPGAMAGGAVNSPRLLLAAGQNLASTRWSGGCWPILQVSGAMGC